MELKLLSENFLFLALFIIGLLPVMSLALPRVNKTIRILIIAGASLALLIVVQRPVQDMVLASALPNAAAHDGMQPSGDCMSCHPGQYASWHASFHRTMTQKVGPDTVVAPFDGRTLQWQGRAFVVHREAEEFWVTEVKADDAQDAGTLEAPKRVVMSTGSRHQQVYWTPEDNGSLKQFPWVYEISLARWIPSEHSFLRPPDWTQHQPTWNESCIRCHTVGALPNFNREQNQWDTQVTELGIACAGCHGPGEEHIRRHRNPLRRHLQRILDVPDPTIVNPRRLTQERSAAVCGQCHAFALLPGGFYEGSWPHFRSGKKLDQYFSVSNSAGQNSESMFWPDGSARTGGREHNSMVLSGCFTNGEMTCVSCHSLHGSEPLDLIEPAMNGDAACVQCHEQIGDNLASHTFHEPESSGSRCLNCHMPYTTYGLLATARSHRIDSPVATGHTTRDRPNACNLCHLDKTLAWTAEHLSDRYGVPAPTLPDEHNEVAASVLWALRGDAAQRAIVAWHMGQPWAVEVSGENWEAPYLSLLLTDPYSVVRLIAYRSLTQLTGDTIPFDFLGTEQQQQNVRQAYLGIWQLFMRSSDELPPATTLMAGPGWVRWDAVETFYNQRDNRRLFISE